MVTTSGEALRCVINDAVNDSYEFVDDQVSNVHAAVSAHLQATIPDLIVQAIKDPKVHAAVSARILYIIEDEINDKHDTPATPEMYRPGLRAAARLVRECRRKMEEGTG